MTPDQRRRRRAFGANMAAKRTLAGISSIRALEDAARGWTRHPEPVAARLRAGDMSDLDTLAPPHEAPAARTGRTRSRWMLCVLALALGVIAALAMGAMP